MSADPISAHPTSSIAIITREYKMAISTEQRLGSGFFENFNSKVSPEVGLETNQGNNKAVKGNQLVEHGAKRESINKSVSSGLFLEIYEAR